MKIVICGGTGQLGNLLCRAFQKKGDEVVLLTRRINPQSLAKQVLWDGVTLGPWAQEIEGADVVINLAGRSVNCRYTPTNLQEMMDSRVKSTQVVGEAIAKAMHPPQVWLQMSTATIYAHTYGPANDEQTGMIGGQEPGIPRYWDFSVAIAKAWEQAQNDAHTPQTRKVALRTAMVMSPDQGGVFDMLYKLARFRLGGSVAEGKQFVSFIHEYDFVKAVLFLIERADLQGPINLAAPQPLPQKELMFELRKAAGISFGLPATKWMLEIGAFFLRTDTELLLKSRRVIPRKLLEAGFSFQFPKWSLAVQDLVHRTQEDKKRNGASAMTS